MTFGENYWAHARVGDLVYDVADPRHVGELKAVAWRIGATIRWIETGWISENVLLDDLRLACELYPELPRRADALAS